MFYNSVQKIFGTEFFRYRYKTKIKKILPKLKYASKLKFDKAYLHLELVALKHFQNNAANWIHSNENGWLDQKTFTSALNVSCK